MHDLVCHRDGSVTVTCARTAAQLEAFFGRLGVQSHHYLRAMAATDFRPNEALALLGALPRTDKSAYRNELALEALEGLRGESFVTDFSSGSTDRPVLRYCRPADDLSEQEATEGAFRRAGIGPGDRLVFVDVGAAQIYDFYCRAARALGVADTVFLPLTQNDAAAVAALVRLQPSILCTIPTLLAGLWDRLGRTDMHRNPPRGVIFVGEPVSERLRAAVRARWRCRTMSFFGTTETGGFASECNREDGHHFDPSEVLVTVGSARGVDAQTIEGELLVTTPLLRTHAVVKYAVGDVVRVSVSPCPCGDPTPRLWHVRRIQDAFVFAGENFTYDMILEALRKVAPLLHSLTLEIEDLPEGPERVLLRGSLPAEFRPLLPALARVLREDVFELDCLVRYGLVRVDLVCREPAPGRLPTGRKGRRLVDRRAMIG